VRRQRGQHPAARVEPAGHRVEAGDPAGDEDQHRARARLAEGHRPPRSPHELPTHQAQRRARHGGLPVRTEVPGEHPLLQHLDRLRRVEAGLAELGAEVGHPTQRLGGPAGSSQRRHQPGDGRLAERVGEHQGLEGGHGLVVPPEGRQGVRPLLARGQPQRGQSGRGVTHPREVVVRRERGAAPPVLGLVEELDGPLGWDVGRLTDEGLEAGRVEVVSRQRQAVAAGPCLDQVGPEARAHARDQDLDRVGGVARGVAVPERIGQAVDRHGGAGLGGEEREQRGLAPAGTQGHPVDDHLEGPEDPDAAGGAGHASSWPSAGWATTGRGLPRDGIPGSPGIPSLLGLCNTREVTGVPGACDG
jgi:hypothetical protein